MRKFRFSSSIISSAFIRLFLLLTFISYSQTYNGYNYNGWRYVKLKQEDGHKSKILQSNFFNGNEQNDNLKFIENTQGETFIVVSPSFSIGHLDKLGLKYEVLHEDVGKLIKKRHVTKKIRKRSVPRNDRVFHNYLTWPQMENYFHNLQAMYPQKIRKEIIGRSYEGRNIYMFTVSKTNRCGQSRRSRQPKTREGQFQHHSFRRNQRSVRLKRNAQEQRRTRNRGLRSLIIRRAKNERNATHNLTFLDLHPFISSLNQRSQVPATNSPKPVIFLDGGTHSREWISPAASLYLIKHLAQTPSLVEHVDWKIVPMANPDGYVYSWNHDRFWRKTRSNTSYSGCNGADINRNFGHRWGEVDTSRFPCYEHYGGSRAFSEVETAALKRALSSEKKRLKAYISLHNWGQDIVYPYSFSREHVPFSKQFLNDVSEGMTNAISKTSKTKYKSGPAAHLLYPASGTAIDWVYDSLGAPLSFLLELRDSDGILGFMLPEKFIIPTSKDLVAAMTYLASVVKRNTSLS